MLIATAKQPAALVSGVGFVGVPVGEAPGFTADPSVSAGACGGGRAPVGRADPRGYLHEPCEQLGLLRRGDGHQVALLRRAVIARVVPVLLFLIEPIAVKVRPQRRARRALGFT